MSFADDLRNIDPKAREAEQLARAAKGMAQEMLSTAQNACARAANSGKRSISGYVRWYVDDGYPEREFVSALPSAKQYQGMAMESRRWSTSDIYGPNGTHTYEDRLYVDFLHSPYPSDLSFARMVRNHLILGIQKLGFIRYNVTIQALEDIYMVRKITRGCLVQRKSLTTRKGPQPIYLLKIEIAW